MSTLPLAAGRWPAEKTFEDAFRAAVEEQYLPTVPVPVPCIEIFHNSAAEADIELLKLPIRGDVHIVQAKSASLRQWRKWIEAAALEWEKIQGGIPLHEKYILDTQEKTDPRNTNRFAEPWKTQLLSSTGNRVDLLLHRPCGSTVEWQPRRRPRRNRKEAEGAR